MKCHINCFSFSGKRFHSHAIIYFNKLSLHQASFIPSPLTFFSGTPPSLQPQRSSMTGVPLLSLQGALELNQGADPLQNEDLVHMWMEVKMKPLLKSITKSFLSCLSTKNFSCSTYRTVYVWVSVYMFPFPTLQQLLTIWPLPAGWGSSVTISLRWIQSDRSGSTLSSCNPFCLETE